MQREDDKETTIKQRLKIYKKETKPILDFYRSDGILRDIDGARPIGIIYKEIKDILKKKPK